MTTAGRSSTLPSDPATSEALIELSAAVDDEVSAWEAALTGDGGYSRVVYPDPHEDNGVPATWRIHARFDDFEDRHDAILIQRPFGDWLVMTHLCTGQTSTVLMVHHTLTGLHDLLAWREQRAIAFGNSGEFYGRMAAWVRDIVVGMYDETDRGEVAERMLFAMGSHKAVPPRQSGPRQSGSC
jgi:hypothetical protein